MPRSGDHGQKALIGDWIYCFGFEHGHSPIQINHTGTWDGKERIRCPGEYLAQRDVFKIHSSSENLRPSQWIRLSDIPRPVSHSTAIILHVQYILVAGGIGPVGDRHVSHIQLFNSRLNRWRLLSPLPITTKTPLLWVNEEQSNLYFQSCSVPTKCLNYQTHIIWAHQPKTERCLFYTHLNCTTRQLQRTPFAKYRRATESRWTILFSTIYMLHMPESVERLRRVWIELNRMELTSITLFEGFRVRHMEKIPLLIQEDLIWPTKMEMWKAKNDTNSIRHYVLSNIALKLIFMNLWTRNIYEKPLIEHKPVLIMEDDLQFLRSRDETLQIVETTLAFLRKHSEIEWDLLYLSYRSIDATRTHQISEKPPISLWRASRVLSNTAFIINQNRQTVERLNQCYLTRLDIVDISISYCAKHQFIRAYLIEPKLVQALAGFSESLNHFHDYKEDVDTAHTLGKDTPPATFKSSTDN